MTWTYEAACAALARSVDLEKQAITSEPPVPSLARMRELARRLGDPQRRFDLIHLTGTNGKTSTARIAAALLGAAGLRVGLYTSPHLERVNERLVGDGVPIDDDAFAACVGAAVDAAAPMAERPTFFELLTAAAYHWFAERGVDAAVVEVGLLGRWDATNIADGRVAVITGIGADHLDYAGSLAGVAREKAGIVKPGARLVLGEIEARFDDVFAAAPASRVRRGGHDFAMDDAHPDPAGRRGDLRTPLARYDGVLLSLHGAYQDMNAACALTAVEEFLDRPLPDAVVREGLGAVRAPGRLEIVGDRPLAVLDGAHNPAAAAALARSLAEEFPDRRWTVVYGALRGHDFEGTLAELPADRIAALVCCEPDSPRAIPAEQVTAAARRRGIVADAVPPVADAVRLAMERAASSGAILVTGSFYHLSEARRVLAAVTRP
ncbi:Folylpolyglutamate synthase/dihydrofolate synthase [Frankia canadensis]|uniref:tetrahydrofolate synthase n=1 Tax=Frankia canadensis TaxID=1836972 RepID=A0A2I2KVG4_9ACTN|nr:Mur ligase family protein [Frankia canadensis]SNQ49651.1 Folylpolyglutamate synthase/dihydrofolate synthase [Frankia canadensis]SOU56941.1 Folylpolyglutamate synthase/dihydrofolate synthase [Frankia canadensis]